MTLVLSLQNLVAGCGYESNEKVHTNMCSIWLCFQILAMFVHSQLFTLTGSDRNEIWLLNIVRFE